MARTHLVVDSLEAWDVRLDSRLIRASSGHIQRWLD
jgi:hypothetical protein